MLLQLWKILQTILHPTILPIVWGFTPDWITWAVSDNTPVNYTVLKLGAVTFSRKTKSKSGCLDITCLMIWFVPQDGEKLPSGKNIGFVPLHNKNFNLLFKELNKSCVTCSKLLIQTPLCSIDAHQRRKECMVRQAQFDIYQLLLSNRVQETISKVTDIFSVDSCLIDPNILINVSLILFGFVNWNPRGSISVKTRQG